MCLTGAIPSRSTVLSPWGHWHTRDACPPFLNDTQKHTDSTGALTLSLRRPLLESESRAFLDIDTGKSFVDSPGCRQQNIPQPGFSTPPCLLCRTKHLPPESCPLPERSGHSEDLQKGVGAGVPGSRLSEPAWATLLWTRRWEQMAYKDRSGQGCFFFFLPSSLASLALGAGGAVGSLQAHCPSHTEAGCGTSQRDCAGNAHPSSQAWQRQGCREP